MIIKSKPLSPFLFRVAVLLITFVFKRKCKRLVIEPCDIKPEHSYILMCNHFSFWDGFFAYYMIHKVLFKTGHMKNLYVMSLKKQMEKNPWMRYTGSFSVDPGRRSINESFDYAAEILAEPGNVLLFYPQGKLESNHIRYIKFDEGIYEIVQRVKSNCQLLWSSNIIEFFESLKPTVYGYMLDCGTNKDFNFEGLKDKVNQHHKASIMRNVRYTVEPEN